MEKSKKKSAENIVITRKRTAQNLINFKEIDRDGICVLDGHLYSKTVCFLDINYQSALIEEKSQIIEKYANILNSFGNSINLEMTILSHPIDIEHWKDIILAKPVDDNYNELRKHTNDALIDLLENGRSKITTDKLLTYTVKADTYEEAKKQLSILDYEILDKLSDLGCHPRILDMKERLEIFNFILNPYRKFFFDYDDLNAYTNPKEFIVPEYFDFHSKNDSFRINDRYAKCFKLKNYPSLMKDTLIYEMTKLDYNISLSYHSKAVPRGKDVGLIKNQFAKIQGEVALENRKALQQGYNPDMLPQSLEETYIQTKQKLEDVERGNERLFTTEMIIMINEENKIKFEKAEKAIMLLFEQFAAEIETINYKQEYALNQVLPLGHPFDSTGRMMSTNEYSIIIPFTSMELMHQTKYALSYGINQISYNLITADKSLLLNPATWILALPGAGKSFYVKAELTQVLTKIPEADVIVIDPQGEYSVLANSSLYHGISYKIDSKSNVYLNPLDGNSDDIIDFIKTKTEFVHALVSGVLLGEYTAYKKGIVEMATKEMYRKFRIEKRNYGHLRDIPSPTLKDLKKELESDMWKNNKEAKEMATALYQFTEGTNDIFAHQTSINNDGNRFVVYDTSEIGETIRPLGYKVILETLRSKVLENHKKGKKTFIYIDEIYLILKDEYSQNFMFEFFKWSRKYNCIITGITQNVSELLVNMKTKTMLGNAEFITMLAQSADDLAELAAMLNLSEEQMKILRTAEKGTGLIAYGNSIIPFANKYRKDTEIYRLWTTDPDEKRKYKEQDEVNENMKNQSSKHRFIFNA